MMSIRNVLLATTLTMSTISTASAVSQDPPLIPRDTLFGNPERAGVQISPDGKWISYLAPRDGVLNVWVMARDGGEPRPVTDSTDRPIRSYSWSWNNEQILYSQDKGGDENTHIYAVDLASGKTTDLTPGDDVKASLMSGHRDRPDQILVQTNARDAASMDVVRIDTRTGESTPVFENTGGYIQMVPDDDWAVRVRARMNAEGGTESEFRDSPEGEWRPLDSVGLEDAMTTSTIGFDKSGKRMWSIDARGGDKARLVSVTANPDGTFDRETVFQSNEADVADAMINPQTLEPEAIAVNRLRKEWTIVDPAVRPDLEKLATLVDGEVEVIDRSGDDRTWIVAYLVDDGPVQYWLWDRDAQDGRYLFSNRPSLDGLPLVKMRAVEIPARDGLMLPSYYSLPHGWKEGDKVPLVVMVHGGPWARDNWGYNPYHQWLTNRGYAVLNVNFRGSTGFGKDFLNAGNREWYAKMQDDVNDVAQWAVDQGWADPDRLAIMGGSYGGYATLAGMTRDPELWACGVDIVGPSHISTLLSTIPPYWAPMKAMFEQRVGSMDEPEYLDSISPLTHVERISRPLLIGQGANDPRVKISESDQIVAAMEERGIPVTYVVFPDEGHGFARPENNNAFNAVVEAFLAEHLGGRIEPLDGEIEASTAQLRNLGGLDLAGAEAWDPKTAPEPEVEKTVTWEMLDEAQQAKVEQVLEQIEAQVPEPQRRFAYPAIATQFRGQIASAPEEDRMAILYAAQELDRRAGEAMPAGADPVPEG
ncbi:MAG: S9 family peptidase [Planctomycetota bacterium]|nr:S9 family peptidase [Planctomycetota bacterium]